jgi:hypothetical protein
MKLDAANRLLSGNNLDEEFEKIKEYFSKILKLNKWRQDANNTYAELEDPIHKLKIVLMKEKDIEVTFSYRGESLPYFSKSIRANSFKDVQHKLQEALREIIAIITSNISNLEKLESVFKSF